MIFTRSLTKRFGRIVAVDSVDLSVAEGSRYGVLGPNGSGKTTLVRMLLGLVYASSGEIEIMGRPVPARVRDVLPQIGALVEEPAAYPNLSGRANLTLLDAAGPRGDKRTRRKRVGEALEKVGLAGIDRRPVKAYSLGMRQRLGLAAALMRSPALLILDEPTNGLDPRGIRDVRDLLIELNEAGTTVVMSSHLLGEVEQLCTHVGIFDCGRLVLQDELAALREPAGRVLIHSPDADAVATRLDGRVESREGARMVVRHDDAALLNAELVRAGIRVTEIGPHRRSLEQVVLDLTSAGSDQIAAAGGRPAAPGPPPPPASPASPAGGEPGQTPASKEPA